MKTFKKIGLVLLIVFIIIQFIQPGRNKSGQVLNTDITIAYTVPRHVLAGLRSSCFDCHSNNTSYPWYSYIQPVGWLLASDVRQGKSQLNFSEFGSYSPRRQISKLKGIESSIKDGTMPLGSYTLIHRNAKLSKEDKALIIDWLAKTRDSLTSKVE